jgi:hypothetical protein
VRKRFRHHRKGCGLAHAGSRLALRRQDRPFSDAYQEGVLIHPRAPGPQAGAPQPGLPWPPQVVTGSGRSVHPPRLPLVQSLAKMGVLVTKLSTCGYQDRAVMGSPLVEGIPSVQTRTVLVLDSDWNRVLLISSTNARAREGSVSGGPSERPDDRPIGAVRVASRAEAGTDSRAQGRPSDPGETPPALPAGAGHRGRRLRLGRAHLAALRAAFG